MPDFKTSILVLLAPAVAAQAVLAMPDTHADGICDRAARQAARAEGVPLDVLRAIARVETGRTRNGALEPWPWTVNLEGQGYWFNSEIEAKSYVFDIFKSGKRSFDVGCFQINYRWHGKAFRSIDAMFNPTENATYAARFLNQLYAELGSWPAAAGAYHSRTQALADRYSERFQLMLARIEGGDTRQIAGAERDRFMDAARPLIPLDSQPRQSVLGSLVPAAGTATAFITFK